MIICPCCKQAIEKTCEQCGEKFYPNNQKARFCSHACRQKDFRVREIIGAKQIEDDE